MGRIIFHDKQVRILAPFSCTNAELYPSIEGAFIIPDDTQTPLVVSGVNMEYEQFVTLQSSVDTIAEYGRTITGTWSGLEITRNWCSFCALVDVEGAKIGTLVKPQALLESMPFFAEDEHHFVLAKHNGFVLLTNLPDGIDESVDLTGDLSGCYQTGETGDITVCGAQTQTGPFRLMMLSTQDELMSGLKWTRWGYGR